MDVLSDVLRAVRLTGAVFFDVGSARPGRRDARDAAHRRQGHAGRRACDLLPHLLDGSLLGGARRRADSAPSGSRPATWSSSRGRRNVMARRRAARRADLAIYYRPPDHQLPFVLERVRRAAARRRASSAAISAATRGRSIRCSTRCRACCTARRPPDRGGWLAELIRVAVEESERQRAGGETILAKLSELMFVEVDPQLHRHPAGGLARLARRGCAIRTSARRCADARAAGRGLDARAAWRARSGCRARPSPTASPTRRHPADAVSRPLAHAARRAAARAPGVSIAAGRRRGRLQVRGGVQPRLQEVRRPAARRLAATPQDRRYRGIRRRPAHALTAKRRPVARTPSQEGRPPGLAAQAVAFASMNFTASP